MKIVDESILFFSRVSLSKFSLKALLISWVSGSIYSRVRKECEESIFPKQGGLATGLSHEFKLRANGLASLGLLSCSATTGITL